MSVKGEVLGLGRKEYVPGEIILSAPEINRRLSQLAPQIARDYQGLSYTSVGLLLGAEMVHVDLSRMLYEYSGPKIRNDTLLVSSYNGSHSTGNTRIVDTLKYSVEGQHILIVEDIIDTAQSMVDVLEFFRKKNAASIKVMSLLSKPSRRVVSYEADYTGFSIPDAFVVGYGLDFEGLYRLSPDIMVYPGNPPH